MKNCNGVLVSFTRRKIKLVLVFISKMTSFVSGTGSVPLKPCFVFIFKNPVKAIFLFDNSNRHSKYSLFNFFFFVFIISNECKICIQTYYDQIIAILNLAFIKNNV